MDIDMLMQMHMNALSVEVRRDHLVDDAYKRLHNVGPQLKGMFVVHKCMFSNVCVCMRMYMFVPA